MPVDYMKIRFVGGVKHNCVEEVYVRPSVGFYADDSMNVIDCYTLSECITKFGTRFWQYIYTHTVRCAAI